MRRGIRKDRARRRVAAFATTIALLVGASLADVASAETGEPGVRERRSDLVDRWREATPAERREMRAQLRRRWEDAPPRQRRRIARRMKALERALPDFSAIERLILLRAAAALPETERRALRERIRRIDDLSPEERAKLIGEMQAMIREYEGEVDRLERNKSRWEGMSEAERDEFREQMRRWRAMSLEERRALLEEMREKKRTDGPR